MKDIIRKDCVFVPNNSNIHFLWFFFKIYCLITEINFFEISSHRAHKVSEDTKEDVKSPHLVFALSFFNFYSVSSGVCRKRTHTKAQEFVGKGLTQTQRHKGVKGSKKSILELIESCQLE